MPEHHAPGVGVEPISITGTQALTVRLPGRATRDLSPKPQEQKSSLQQVGACEELFSVASSDSSRAMRRSVLVTSGHCAIRARIHWLRSGAGWALPQPDGDGRDPAATGQEKLDRCSPGSSFFKTVRLGAALARTPRIDEERRDRKCYGLAVNPHG